jgi:hypothetical protein
MVRRVSEWLAASLEMMCPVRGCGFESRALRSQSQCFHWLFSFFLGIGNVFFRWLQSFANTCRVGFCVGILCDYRLLIIGISHKQVALLRDCLRVSQPRTNNVNREVFFELRLTRCLCTARESNNSDVEGENLHGVRQSPAVFLWLDMRVVVRLPPFNLLDGPVTSTTYFDEGLRNLAFRSPSSDGFRIETEVPSERLLVNECLDGRAALPITIQKKPKMLTRTGERN